MVFRGEWDREVLFVRHLSGEHDQKKHGRKGSNPSILRQAEAREGLLGLLGGEPAGPSDARRMKVRAAQEVAEGWDVSPEEAITAAMGVSPGTGLEDIADILALPKAEQQNWVIERNMLESGAVMVHGESHYLVRRAGPPSGAAVGVRFGTPAGDKMVKEAAASSLIGKWADTSNDNDPGALALQECIRREFGLTDAADWQYKSFNSYGYSFTSTTFKKESLVADHGPVLQKFTRSMYNATQRDLAAHGITEVGVVRGYGGTRDPHGMPPLARVRTTLRPASAWTVDHGIAEDFGYNRLVTTVPASSVLSTPRTGFGCLQEKEVVLLGRPIVATRVDRTVGLAGLDSDWTTRGLRLPGPESVMLDRLADEGGPTWKPGMTMADWVNQTTGVHP